MDSSDSRPLAVLVTGSRNFNQDAGPYLECLVRALPDLFSSSVVLVHGGARGADTAFGDSAKERGWNVESYPADWVKHGRAAGPIRNSMLVSLDPDIAIVILAKDSKGTKDCYTKLLKAKGRLRWVLLVTETEVKLNQIA